MSYTLGIIGSGNIGHALAAHLSRTPYQVMITNSRGPASLTEMVNAIGGSLTAAGLTETIRQADVLFLAMPWSGLQVVAGEVSAYSGKILVDATNNIISVSPFQLADTGGKTTGEYTAGLFPGQHVVKAFNTLGAATLASPPQSASGSRVIFMSGDESDPKKVVAEIIKAIGFEPIDLGTLKEGGKLQDVGGALSGVELVKVKR
jgi:predicted dinucleotide-binding enzyme